MKKFVLSLIMMLVIATAALAATITVGPGGSYNHLTIQAAIDAATSGDLIHVYPGTYNETASNCNIITATGTQGPYQFGLFFPQTKPGISIIGVDNSGTPITSYSGVAASVTTNATNSFGESGIFVNADNITIQGLKILDNVAGYGNNKTVEIIGNNFTMKYCHVDINDGGSIYFNDWSFAGGVSTQTKYNLTGNNFAKGCSVDICNGTGYTGSVSDRVISGNLFTGAGCSWDLAWAAISFNGIVPAVGWFTAPVGAATISGNTFADYSEFIIRTRGTVDATQFNWQNYWNNNTFEKAVITLSDAPAFTPRSYSYTTSGGKTFLDVRRIGGAIQQDITNVAQAGDVIEVAAGTYTGHVSITKNLTLNGAQVGVDARTRSGSESLIQGTFSIAAGLTSVTIDGFKFKANSGANELGIGGPYHSGIYGTVAGTLIIQNNILEGAANTNGPSTNPGLVYVTGNAVTFLKNKVDQIIACPLNTQSAYIVVSAGGTGMIDDNTFAAGLGLGANTTSTVSVTDNVISGAYTEGIWFWPSAGSVLTITGNTVSGFGTCPGGPFSALKIVEKPTSINGQTITANMLTALQTSNANIPSFLLQWMGPVHNVTKDLYYNTIQLAINGADASDVIEVAAGTYNETVAMGSMALTLKGANYGVAGSGSRSDESRVTGGFVLNGSANVIIDGFSVTGSNVAGSRGILLGNTSVVPGPVTLSNNILENWTTCISLAGGATPAWVSNVTVSRNLIRNNTAGIGSTENVAGLTVSNNTFSGNAEGIGLGAGLTGFTVTGNTFATNNTVYIASYGVGLMPTFSSIFAGNSFVTAAGVSSATGGLVSAIYPTIAAAITNANVGASIEVAAGTYNENVTVDRRITLNGAGSATTTIQSATASTPVISITGSGSDASNRLIVSNLKITGATGSGNPGSGILVIGSAACGYMTFDELDINGNGGEGLVFNNTYGVTDIVVSNSSLSSNTGSGIRIASAVPTFNGMNVIGCTIQNNGSSGFNYNPSSSLNTGTNFTFTNTNFITNNTLGTNNVHDVSMLGFNGSATFTNVDVNCNNPNWAMVFGGYHVAPFSPAGAITFNGVTVSGSVGKSGIYFFRYSDASSVSLNGLDVKGLTAGWGIQVVCAHTTGSMNLGNTSLKTLKTESTGAVNATGANFYNSSGVALNKGLLADNFQIENQVYHKLDNSTLGLVTWMADNVYVTTNSGSIQRGIDAATAGWTANVAAGTYTEQLHITTNNLTIQGASKSTVLLKSPASLPLYFTTTTYQNHPIVFVDGVNTFTLKNITVDGDGKGNANYRFQGIGFWNAGGVVENVDVLNIMDTPFSGAQHGIAVYAFNNTNGPYNISCSDMVIDDYQKNAMALSGTGLTVALDNITTIGAGPTSVTAQNGIQVAYGAGGTIINSNVSGNIYTGSGWSSAGILLYQGSSVAITNTVITDNTTGLDVNDCNGSMSNSTVSNQNSESWDGIYIRKYQNTSMTFDVTGVTIMGHGKADSWGVLVRANTGTITSSITQCSITNWGLGVYTREVTGGIVSVLTKNNVISGNTEGYYANTITPQDATLNYWSTCPSVSGPATYFPYWSTVSGDPGSFDFDGSISNITASASPTTICLGQSTTLTAGDGSNFLWDNDLGLGATKLVTPATIGSHTYNVTGNDTHGCSGGFDAVSVTVEAAPTVSIGAVTVGGTTTLTASGATNYVWSTGFVGNPLVVSPSVTTIYTVTGTNGSGCSGSASKEVSVVTVTIGPNQYICEGSSVTLTATVTGHPSPTYSWSNGSTEDHIVVSPTSDTPYTVTVNGITGPTASVWVYVYPKPVAIAGLDKIYAGTAVPLNGSASDGTAPYTYAWTGPNGFTSSLQTPSVSVIGTYTLIVTDAYGCSSNADYVEVTAPLIDTYTVSGNVSYAFNLTNNQMHLVEVKLVGLVETYIGYTASTGNGDYVIPGVPNGAYTVYLSSPKPWGGVTSTDITLIANDYRPRNPIKLIGIKRLAADVVDNSTSAIIDPGNLDKNMVNSKRLNPSVQFQTGNWVFTKADATTQNSLNAPGFTYVYAHAGNPTANALWTAFSNITLTVSGGNLINQDFKALCYGDVDASYTGLKILEISGPTVSDGTEDDWFELSNYPNPFAGQTTFRYSQSVEGKVSIRIFNTMGNLLKTIDNNDQSEGQHKLSFNAQGLASGVYLYVLTLTTSDDIMQQTGKMIINK
jgi:hypothetical protein